MYALYIRFLSRNLTSHYQGTSAQSICFQRHFCNKKNKSSKDESTNTQVDQNSTESSSVSRLNNLLKSMIEDDTKKVPDVELAKPKKSNSKNKLISLNLKSDREVQTIDKKIVEAAKDVATSLGGNVKQTESVLLSKLLGHAIISETSAGEDESAKTPLNLSELIVGMKIDRTKKPDVHIEESRAQQVQKVFHKKGVVRSWEPRVRVQRSSEDRPGPVKISSGRVNLFDSPLLGIFKLNEIPEKETVYLSTWEKLNRRELKLSVMHPPENYFQKMILWTDQGKIWKFPIDNEQGMEEEANVYFADHVFLESHLEPWCPPRGPIRHFMELVCVGLSKNCYLSIKNKRDHIEWYKNYFESKKDILKEVGIDMDLSSTSNEVAKGIEGESKPQ